MFNSIVVSLDGSELSEKALPYAVKMANALGLKLTLIRVAEISDFPDDPYLQTRIKETNEYLEYLKDFLNRQRPNPQLSINPEILVLIGEPAEEICEFIRKEPGALLVMTTHGRTGFSRLMTGSVAGKVLRKLHLPVLLVRPFGLKHTHTLQELLSAEDEPYARTFLENGVRLLVPLDQTEKSETVLDTAFTLATDLNAPVHFITVSLPAENVFYGEAVTMAFSQAELEKREDRIREAAAIYLGQIAQLAHEKGVESVTQVSIGDPGQQIMSYASQIEPDLILMATRARGEIGRFIYGSVANQLLQSTHLPVLMVPVTSSTGKLKTAPAVPAAANNPEQKPLVSK